MRSVKLQGCLKIIHYSDLTFISRRGDSDEDASNLRHQATNAPTTLGDGSAATADLSRRLPSDGKAVSAEYFKTRGSKSSRRADHHSRSRGNRSRHHQQLEPAVLSILGRETAMPGQSDPQESHYAPKSTTPTLTPAGMPSISPLLQPSQLAIAIAEDSYLDTCANESPISSKGRRQQANSAVMLSAQQKEDNGLHSRTYDEQPFDRGVVTSKRVFDHRHDPVPMLKGTAQTFIGDKTLAKQRSRRRTPQPQWSDAAGSALKVEEPHLQPSSFRPIMKREKWEVERIDAYCCVPTKDFVLNHRMDESERGAKSTLYSKLSPSETNPSISELDISNQLELCYKILILRESELIKAQSAHTKSNFDERNLRAGCSDAFLYQSWSKIQTLQSR